MYPMQATLLENIAPAKSSVIKYVHSYVYSCLLTYNPKDDIIISIHCTQPFIIDKFPCPTELKLLLVYTSVWLEGWVRGEASIYI